MALPRLQPDEVRIAPSLLSADFGSLAEAIGEVATATDWMHVDVMDGHFVPNLTIGPPVVESLRRHTGMILDCHLMMTNPGDYLEAFKKAGADSASVHAEIGGTADLIDEMRKLDLGVGLALNPDTPFEAVEPFLPQIDLLLVMSVFPGFGGQHFMAEVLAKISEARRRHRRARCSRRAAGRRGHRRGDGGCGGPGGGPSLRGGDRRVPQRATVGGCAPPPRLGIGCPGAGCRRNRLTSAR